MKALWPAMLIGIIKYSPNIGILPFILPILEYDPSPLHFCEHIGRYIYMDLRDI